MKKTIICTLLSIAIGGILAFSGCGKNMYYHEISSVDDLYAMKSNKCYQLTCDIDLQEREWYPLEVKGFKGNGYTIRNCYINESTAYYCIGFFTEITWLENVVFENIQVNITFTDSKDGDKGYYAGYNAGGIIAGEASEVDNITVRNSEAVFNIGWSSNLSTSAWLGGIVGKGSIKNSVFEESSLTCNITSNNDSYIGGIVGYCSSTLNNISNNKVINSEINTNCKSYTNCGGIIGCLYANGVTLVNCITKDSIIDIQSSSSTTSRTGGIIGYCRENGEINNCASIGNNIKLKSSYGYNIGGIIGKADGKVTNCLSDSNVLEGITSSAESKQYAGVGGLCGSTSATISKSVVQNNKIIGTNSTKSDSMFAAGFIASATASIVNCAVYNNTVNGGNKDIFTSKNEDLIFNCSIAGIGQTSPNVNNLPNISDENWKDVINTLSLDEKLWTFESGYLNLKIAE